MRNHVGMILPLIALTMAGCDSDERLVRHAEQSVATQKQQNEWISRQSELVAKQGVELAQAARELVASDANARAEILAAQRDVRAEAAKLDDERRELAAARNRETLWIAAFDTFGGIALCLAPLAIAGYVLHELHRPELGSETLNEFLLAEMVDYGRAGLLSPPSNALPSPIP